MASAREAPVLHTKSLAEQSLCVEAALALESGIRMLFLIEARLLPQCMALSS